MQRLGYSFQNIKTRRTRPVLILVVIFSSISSDPLCGLMDGCGLTFILDMVLSISNRSLKNAVLKTHVMGELKCI
jgi:hypothetical protein